VNFSRALKIATLAIAIILTVTLKTFTTDRAQPPTSNNLKEAVVRLLEHHGFAIQVGNRAGFVVEAQRESCHLQIQEAAAEGYNLDAIMSHAPPQARLVFAYRGDLLSQLPRFRIVISKLWNRIEWKLRLSSSWSPVLSIIPVGDCRLNDLPWNELAELPLPGQ